MHVVYPCAHRQPGTTRYRGIPGQAGRLKVTDLGIRDAGVTDTREFGIEFERPHADGRIQATEVSAANAGLHAGGAYKRIDGKGLIAA